MRVYIIYILNTLAPVFVKKSTIYLMIIQTLQTFYSYYSSELLISQKKSVYRSLFKIKIFTLQPL